MSQIKKEYTKWTVTLCLHLTKNIRAFLPCLLPQGFNNCDLLYIRHPYEYFYITETETYSLRYLVKKTQFTCTATWKRLSQSAVPGAL